MVKRLEWLNLTCVNSLIVRDQDRISMTLSQAYRHAKLCFRHEDHNALIPQHESYAGNLQYPPNALRVLMKRRNYLFLRYAIIEVTVLITVIVNLTLYLFSFNSSKIMPSVHIMVHSLIFTESRKTQKQRSTWLSCNMLTMVAFCLIWIKILTIWHGGWNYGICTILQIICIVFMWTKFNHSRRFTVYCTRNLLYLQIYSEIRCVFFWYHYVFDCYWWITL